MLRANTLRRGRGVATLAAIPWAAAAALWLAAAPTYAASPAKDPPGSGLTVQQATARSLARPEVTRWQRARVAGVSAKAALAAPWQSPTVDLGHEQLATGPGANEQSLVFSQTLDVSGRRGLLKRAGHARVAAARARGQAWNVRLVARVRRQFYSALHLQQRAAVLEAWKTRLGQAVALVNKRIAAGESSRYDRQRMQRELRAARTEALANGARLDAARARLAGLMGTVDGGDGVVLRGQLLPPAPAAMVDAASLADQRPDLQALSYNVQAAKLQGQAAGQRWLRSLQLRGGYLTADGGGGRAHGLVIGLSAALPFAGRAALQQRAASARRQALASKRALALQQQAAEITALASLTRRLHRGASELRTISEPARAAMLKTAQAAWRGGELGLLGLLDAQRSATDEALQVLDLEHQARQAAVALTAATEGSSK